MKCGEQNIIYFSILIRMLVQCFGEFVKHYNNSNKLTFASIDSDLRDG